MHRYKYFVLRAFNFTWEDRIRGPGRGRILTLIILPPANEVAGRYCFQSCLSIILFTGAGPHVTITHNALDLNVQAPFQTWDPPLVLTSGGRQNSTVGKRAVASYWNAFLF